MVWYRNREKEIGQHHKMAKKWKGPYRIIAIHEANTSVVEIRSVWNRTDEKNVNIALLKRAFVRPGQQIPQEVEKPEEEKGEGKKKKENEKIKQGKRRARGRRAGRKIRRKRGEKEEKGKEKKEEERGRKKKAR